MHGSVAACLGQWARHCSREEAAALLQQGPLAAHQSPDWTERLGQALTMAAVAQHAASRLACLHAAIATCIDAILPAFLSKACLHCAARCCEDRRSLRSMCTAGSDLFAA